MGKIELKEQYEFSQEGFVSKTLFESENVRVVMNCLEKGQEVPPQALKSQVVMLAVSGNGTFSVGKETYNVKPDSVVLCESMEMHGIKADERMVVLLYMIPKPNG